MGSWMNSYAEFARTHLEAAAGESWTTLYPRGFFGTQGTQTTLVTCFHSRDFA